MKIFSGRVILARGDKTAKVAVERYITHSLYQKKIKRTKKYLVHDEIGVKVGDRVSFAATKPISKLKRWKILEIVKEGK